MDELLQKWGKMNRFGISKHTRRIEEIEGDAARVRFVYLDAILAVESCLQKSCGPPKSVAVSRERRLLGNAGYAEGDNRKALGLYGAAVAAAPPASEELKLAYGNRSAALFALRRFADCLKDIERALAFDCDDKLRNKLEKRRNEAEASDNRRVRQKEEPKAPYEAPRQVHPEIPCASDAVRVINSPEWGRHVLATRDIAVGESLAYEKPFAAYPSSERLHRRCFECLVPCDATIPCEGCDRAMFCGEDCRTRSLDRGHRLECPMMKILDEMDFATIERFALRIALRARSLHPGKELRETAETSEKMAKLDKLSFDPESYASVHTLETNREKRSGEILSNMCFSAAAMLYLAKRHTSLFDDVKNEKDEAPDSDFWFFGGLILHLIMIVSTNPHAIDAAKEDRAGRFVDTEDIASALNPFLSRINHSCSPNVMRVTKERMVFLIAVRPLKKGQQLFDNYGFIYVEDEMQERQYRLQFQYFFRCRCEACAGCWPLHGDLPPVKRNKILDKEYKNIVDLNLMSKLMRGDKILALKILGQLCKNINLLEPNVPSRDFADHQGAIKLCFGLFGDIKYLND